MGWGALLVLAFVPRAFADETEGLAWSAPAECPTGEEVRRAIFEHLPEGAAELRGEVVIEASPRGYRARLTLEGDEGGTRELEAESCRSVARAVALVIALSVDPSAAVALSERLSLADETRGASPERAGAGKNEPPTKAAETDERAEASSASPSVAESRKFAFQLGLGSVLDAAWVPGLSVSFGAHLELVAPWLRLALEGGVPLERAFAGPEGTSVTVQTPFVGLRLCRELWREAPLFLCARARGAFVSASVSPSVIEGKPLALAVLLEPGALVEVPLGAGFALQGSAFLTVPPWAHEFVVLTADGGSELSAFRLGVGTSAALTVLHRFE